MISNLYRLISRRGAAGIFAVQPPRLAEDAVCHNPGRAAVSESAGGNPMRLSEDKGF
jgi:hypothetical protein